MNGLPAVSVMGDFLNRLTFPKTTLSSVPVIATGMTGNPERAAR